MWVKFDVVLSFALSDFSPGAPKKNILDTSKFQIPDKNLHGSAFRLHDTQRIVHVVER